MQDLQKLAKLIRYYSLTSTTKAGSGHPTSAMSAADLLTALFFNGFFKADLDNPEYANNDRFILSKGHAAPVLYSLYAVAGKTAGVGADSIRPLQSAINPEELMTLRKFGSRLEGHPTLAFPYTEVPTGSLGQGLSVGLGMALNAKLDKLSYKTYVMLGDSEMAEGSVWEALQAASHYHLNNLIGILDCNRLGQRGETMLGWDTDTYQKRVESFGWKTMVIDGHDFEQINKALEMAVGADTIRPLQDGRPTMIIAKTVKGKGVSFLEDKDGWHGKPLSAEDLNRALQELGDVDKNIVGQVAIPEQLSTTPSANAATPPLQEGRIAAGDINFSNYEKPTATRKAYGNALANLADAYPNMVVLDAEVSNSTYSDAFKKVAPDRFFEMYIAEQNMVGAAMGFARRGKIPFVSTFAAFLSRAYDQVRMSQYAHSNIKVCGSHAGVSIGEDGVSQMGLEDIAMFRSLIGSVVLYPSDAVSTEKLVAAAAGHDGLVYIRTTRKETKILYTNDKNDENDENDKNEQKLIHHEFRIGGACTLRSSDTDQITVIGAGITLHEALSAYEELQKENINIRVIDLYSIKPIDIETIKKAALETKAIITVEDHHLEGGLGEAVLSALCVPSPLARGDVPQGQRGRTSSNDSTSSAFGTFSLPGEEVKVVSLAVKKEPKSGKPDELLAYEEIDKNAIIKIVKENI